MSVHRLPSTVSNALALAMVALLGWQALTFYFGSFAPRALWLNPAIAGRYIEKLDPAHDTVFTYNIPAMFGDPSPLIFLAKDVPQHDYNPSEEIPVIARE